MVGMDFFRPTPGAGDSRFESFGEQGVLIGGPWLPAEKVAGAQITFKSHGEASFCILVWCPAGVGEDFEEKALLGTLNLENTHFPSCVSC